MVPSKLRNNHGCFVSPLSGDGFVGGFLVFHYVSVLPYGVVGGGWVGGVGWLTRVNARQHAPMTDYPRQGIGTQIAGAIGASNLGTTRMRDRWQVPMRFRSPIWGGWGVGGGETKQHK